MEAVGFVLVPLFTSERSWFIVVGVPYQVSIQLLILALSFY
jgi:hypothetical protein